MDSTSGIMTVFLVTCLSFRKISRPMLLTLNFFFFFLPDYGGGPGPSEPASSLGKTDPFLVPQDLGSPWEHWAWEERKGLAVPGG